MIYLNILLPWKIVAEPLRLVKHFVLKLCNFDTSYEYFNYFFVTFSKFRDSFSLARRTDPKVYIRCFKRFFINFYLYVSNKRVQKHSLVNGDYVGRAYRKTIILITFWLQMNFTTRDALYYEVIAQPEWCFRLVW